MAFRQDAPINQEEEGRTVMNCRNHLEHESVKIIERIFGEKDRECINDDERDVRFIDEGDNILTSPLTVKWGALSIAIGFLVLAFGFSLWQDRQVQTLRHLQMKENGEIKKLLENLMEIRK